MSLAQPDRITSEHLRRFKRNKTVLFASYRGEGGVVQFRVRIDDGSSLVTEGDKTLYAGENADEAIRIYNATVNRFFRAFRGMSPSKRK